LLVYFIYLIYSYLLHVSSGVEIGIILSPTYWQWSKYFFRCKITAGRWLASVPLMIISALF